MRHTRRQFLGAAAGIVILRHAASALTYQANQKLNLALVGLGGRGSWFVETMPKAENVVAACDVNAHKAADAFARLPQARKFDDFRKMLDAMDKGIDAVVVAVPDHSHAVISMAALQRGKHVYCEKPLTHHVNEARALRLAARQKKVATQMGNQGTASEDFRRSLELIQAGLIGEVSEVYVWCEAGGRGKREAPTEKPKPPDYLNWDVWLGPATWRDYHPFWLQWSQWRDFGTCNLGNWGSHAANLAFKALGLPSLWETPGQTIRIASEASERESIGFPRWEVVHYDIPARGKMPPLKLHWQNGRPPGIRDRIEERIGTKLDWGDAGEKRWKDHSGAILIASKGVLWLNEHNTRLKLVPEGLMEALKAVPKTQPRSPGHEQEWLAACRGGAPAWSNFDYSGPLTEFLMLGNVATQFDGELIFDPATMTIANHPAADKALTREYRAGWKL